MKPSLHQWQNLLIVLTKKEKALLLCFLILAWASSLFLTTRFYLEHTLVLPAPGGSYVEGMVGRPRFINPIYASSDVDRDLVELIFAGLLKYDAKGNLVPELAASFEAEKGKIFKIQLRKDIFWHDGQEITTDDVIFTIETLQDPAIKSPLRLSWLGVQAKKISNKEVLFELKDPYPPFLENLTLKIIPKHLWQDIPSENFPLSEYNFEPLGSGPFRFASLEQGREGAIRSLKLQANEGFAGGKPKIEQITLRFFEDQEELLKAAKKGEVQGLTIVSPENAGPLERKLKKHSLVLPRYFALFFNPEKSEFLNQKKIRQALNYGTNKEELLEKVLSGQGQIVSSPILPGFYGFSEPEKIYPFDPQRAEELLEEAGFVRGEKKTEKQGPEFKSQLQKGDRGAEVKALQECLAKNNQIYPEATISGYFGSKTKEAVVRFQERYKEEILEPWGFAQGTGIVGKATREKLNQVCQEKETIKLKLSLVTPDQPFLVETVRILAKQWQALGLELEIMPQEISQLKNESLKKRNYEVLLFGEILGLVPDLYPFWHSSRKQDPGLNLALYQNTKADRLLEAARKETEPQERAQKYEGFQEILLQDAPALFLYNPDLIYLVSPEIKGMKMEKIASPAQRLADIENWYIKTRRVLK